MKIIKWLSERCTEVVGLIELLIGLSTILFVTIFDMFSLASKPPGVFVFVILSGTLSAVIGFGILRHKNWSRILLIFFSGYVIVLKILIYMNVIRFTGDIIRVPPPYIKDTISLLYHIAVILLFTNKKITSKFKTSA